MEYSKKPNVKLISWTADPIYLMAYIRRVMHSEIPDSLEEFKKDPERWLGMPLDKYFEEVLLKDNMPTFQEYVNFTFKLSNVSRNLTHQAIRHRVGMSFSQQSMRCVSAENFADDGLYHMPPNVKDKEEYHKKMLEIQKIYRDALAKGVSVQDARGLLPGNIMTVLTFSCNIRSLIGLINKRLCYKVQDEFREVAMLMMKELEEKVDKRILKWIGAPCKFGYCIMKGENEQQIKDNKFKGSQNTEMCCPNYLSQFRKDIAIEEINQKTRCGYQNCDNFLENVTNRENNVRPEFCSLNCQIAQEVLNKHKKGGQ